MFFKASVFQSHHDRRQITPAKLLISFNANTGFALYSGDILDCTSYNRSSDNTTLSFNCYALPTSTGVTDYNGNNPVQTPRSWYLEDWAGNNLGSTQTSTFTTGP